MRGEAVPLRSCGLHGRENAGMSSEIEVNPSGRISKVSRVKLICPGVGPKARTRVVADGQQVEIPVLRYDRTVGTRAESGTGNKPVQVRYQSHWQIRVWQWEDTMRTELK